MAKIHLEAGNDTEALIQYITNELDDDTLDDVDVDREIVRPDGLATEPLTISVTLMLSATTVVAVGRIIERWLEIKREDVHLKMVLAGFSQSDEAGKAMADLSKKHADVSISYQLPKEPGRDKK